MVDLDNLINPATAEPLTPATLAARSHDAATQGHAELSLLCRVAAFATAANEPGVADALALALVEAGAPLEAAYLADSRPLTDATRAAIPNPWSSGIKPGVALRPQICALIYAPENSLAWISLARAFEHEQRPMEAALSYRIAVQLDASRLDSWMGLERTARSCQAIDISLWAMVEIARKLPENAIVLSNVSAILLQMGDNENARRIAEAALAIDPELTSAIFNLVYAYIGLGRLPDAVVLARKACEHASGNASLLLATIHAAHFACDWTDIDVLHARLVGLIDAGARDIGPFPLIMVPGVTAAQQRAVAEHFAHQFEIPGALPPSPKSAHGRRLRIGYVSSEFRDHATAYLITEAMEKHDRSRFDIFGFSSTSAPNTGFRARLSKAFTALHDIAHVPDDDVAALVRELGIDILVDLNGYTGVMRPGLFARRPAPLQIQWLGYPGTMGASFIDALIGDPVLTPVGSEQNYTERVLRLPVCYQPNDRQRPLLAPPTRASVGLPEGAFVYCSFNSAYKITPEVFDIWCNLLHEVEGSVLWILVDRPTARDNLMAEALKRGLSGKRVIFAAPLGQAPHLARFQLADVFLDTFPCAAHTTASDALWCGVPVVTRYGETFASRVAASLVNAVGLPELAVASEAAYRDLAIRLARDPAELSRLKAALREARKTAPLFDSEATARGLENIYEAEFTRLVAERAGSPNPASV